MSKRLEGDNVAVVRLGAGVVLNFLLLLDGMLCQSVKQHRYAIVS